MADYKVYEIKQSIFKANDDAADVLRAELRKQHCFLLNLMSSPGSGKTTTLTRTVEKLSGEMNIGIMEADIDSDVDAERISRTGVKKVIQLHTGGMCHLDADMTRQGLDEMGTDDLDLVVLENVGNLVCPAEFDTGAAKNAMILSVPEGHDIPPDISGLRRADNQQDRRPALLRFRHGQGRGVCEDAQPRHQNLPDKRKDRRGRGCMVRLASRSGRLVERLNAFFDNFLSKTLQLYIAIGKASVKIMTVVLCGHILVLDAAGFRRLEKKYERSQAPALF